jgi:hypothetical protein
VREEGVRKKLYGEERKKERKKDINNNIRKRGT